MVTGDFKLTASAIAAECGIITQDPRRIDDIASLAFDDDYLEAAGISEEKKFHEDRVRSIVLSGSEIETLDASLWEKLVKFDEIVIARTTPEPKLRIVK